MRSTLIALVSVLFICCGPKSTESFTPSNPLDIAFGDPYVLLASDGKYYMYGTGQVPDGFVCYSSDDMTDWKFEGQVYKGATEESWTVDCFWAPEVYERNGKFYMMFSANWKENPNHEGENFHIGVAISDKPTGPFIENNKPLFSPGYPAIDGNLIDFDGKTYLYYSRCCYENPVESEVAAKAKADGIYDEIEESWIYGVEVKSDLSAIVGEPQLLLRPPVDNSDPQCEWESRSVTDREANRRWTEGSFMLYNEDNQTFYMMYSANFFGGANYAVGYATSKNPLGPFVKSPTNPILQKNIDNGGIVTGTGHNSVTWSKDGKEMYIVYHGRTEKTGRDRVVFIDKLYYDENGLLKVDGPTTK